MDTGLSYQCFQGFRPHREQVSFDPDTAESANCLDPGFKQTLVTESGLKLFKVDVNLLNFSAESSELDISTPDLEQRK